MSIFNEEYVLMKIKSFIQYFKETDGRKTISLDQGSSIVSDACHTLWYFILMWEYQV